jgi:hypothetical protein
MKKPYIIQTLLEYSEVYELVNSFFKDKEKTNLWLNTENHLLGGLEPVEMIFLGRTEKLIKFIKNQLDGI